MNIDILGISELKWTGMGEFNSNDHYIYYCGQESLRRNGVAIMVNKRVQNAILGCNLKHDRVISVHFQGKPFSIRVIQVYAPTSNAEEDFLISPCYSLKLCIQMLISFLFFLLFTSLLFTAICKASPDSHFAFLHFFFLGMVLILVSCMYNVTNLHP